MRSYYSKTSYSSNNSETYGPEYHSFNYASTYGPNEFKFNTTKITKSNFESFNTKEMREAVDLLSLEILILRIEDVINAIDFRETNQCLLFNALLNAIYGRSLYSEIKSYYLVRKFLQKNPHNGQYKEFVEHHPLHQAIHNFVSATETKRKDEFIKLQYLLASLGKSDKFVQVWIQDRNYNKLIKAERFKTMATFVNYAGTTWQEDDFLRLIMLLAQKIKDQDIKDELFYNLIVDKFLSSYSNFFKTYILVLKSNESSYTKNLGSEMLNKEEFQPILEKIRKLKIDSGRQGSSQREKNLLIKINKNISLILAKKFQKLIHTAPNLDRFNSKTENQLESDIYSKSFELSDFTDAIAKIINARLKIAEELKETDPTSSEIMISLLNSPITDFLSKKRFDKLKLDTNIDDYVETSINEVIAAIRQMAEISKNQRELLQNNMLQIEKNIETMKTTLISAEKITHVIIKHDIDRLRNNLFDNKLTETVNEIDSFQKTLNIKKFTLSERTPQLDTKPFIDKIRNQYISQIESLRSEIATMRQKYEDEKKRMQEDHNDLIHETIKENRELKNNLQEAENHFVHLQQMLQSADSKFEDAKSQLEKCKNNLQIERSNNEANLKTINDLEIRIKTHQGEKLKLIKELEKIETNIADYKKEMTKTIEQKDRLIKDMLEQHEKTHQALQNKYIEQCEMIKQYIEENRQILEEKEALELNHEKQLANLKTELNNKLDEKKNEIDQLIRNHETEISGLKKDIDTLNNDLKKERALIVTLELTIRDHVITIQKNSDAWKEEKRKLIENHAEILAQKDQLISDLQLDVSNANKKFSEAEARYINRKNLLEGTISRLEKENNDLRAALDVKDENDKKIQSNNEDISLKKRELRDLENKRTGEMRDKDNAIRQLTLNIQQLKFDLDRQKNLYTEKVNRLEKLINENDQSKQPQLDVKQTPAYKNLERKLQDAESQIARLKVDLTTKKENRVTNYPDISTIEERIRAEITEKLQEQFRQKELELSKEKDRIQKKHLEELAKKDEIIQRQDDEKRKLIEDHESQIDKITKLFYELLEQHKNEIVQCVKKIFEKHVRKIETDMAVVFSQYQTKINNYKSLLVAINEKQKITERALKKTEMNQLKNEIRRLAENLINEYFQQQKEILETSHETIKSNLHFGDRIDEKFDSYVNRQKGYEPNGKDVSVNIETMIKTSMDDPTSEFNKKLVQYCSPVLEAKELSKMIEQANDKFEKENNNDFKKMKKMTEYMDEFNFEIDNETNKITQNITNIFNDGKRNILKKLSLTSPKSRYSTSRYSTSTTDEQSYKPPSRNQISSRYEIYSNNPSSSYQEASSFEEDWKYNPSLFYNNDLQKLIVYTPTNKEIVYKNKWGLEDYMRRYNLSHVYLSNGTKYTFDDLENHLHMRDDLKHLMCWQYNPSILYDNQFRKLKVYHMTNEIQYNDKLYLQNYMETNAVRKVYLTPTNDFNGGFTFEDLCQYLHFEESLRSFILKEINKFVLGDDYQRKEEDIQSSVARIRNRARYETKPQTYIYETETHIDPDNEYSYENSSKTEYSYETQSTREPTKQKRFKRIVTRTYYDPETGTNYDVDETEEITEEEYNREKNN